MGRRIRDWKPDLVADAVVAEHRYRWDVEGSDWNAPDYKTWLASVPYKPGDVIYVEAGDVAVKARVLDILSDRDYLGFRREAYRVQVETKAGLWSKLWEKTHPGFVQRGYLRAGLAPDLEGKL